MPYIRCPLKDRFVTGQFFKGFFGALQLVFKRANTRIYVGVLAFRFGDKIGCFLWQGNDFPNGTEKLVKLLFAPDIAKHPAYSAQLIACRRRGTKRFIDFRVSLRSFLISLLQIFCLLCLQTR